MRAVLWDLLLLCLCARARSDCRGDCLHCDRQLYRDSFDVLRKERIPLKFQTLQRPRKDRDQLMGLLFKMWMNHLRPGAQSHPRMVQTQGGTADAD
ncbi:hypothetical protein WISP_01273 [Willisornis vidua]|uniref:Uncharacterized protein n=1 Tax=Willisornis vidua TaxID=1566151 RepID=A0ABQ9DZS5_9PASS|nr:hypothetical protein WISP_01273 [Willisornis vidua]